MKKITSIYKSLNEEKKLKQDVSVNDLIKDKDMSLAAKEATIKKKWAISSNDIEEVIEFKQKKLAAELAKLKDTDTNESNITEEEENEYEKFFNLKLKKWNIKSPNELSDEDKKRFFDEIEKEWDKDNEAAVAFLEEKKKCISKKVKEDEEKVEESLVATGVVLSVALFLSAKALIKKLVDNKKKKKDTLYKISKAKDEETKAKLEDQYKELNQEEKDIKEEIVKAKENLDTKESDIEADEKAKAKAEIEKITDEISKIDKESTELRAEIKESNESELVDLYTSKYFHFYEKMFSQVDTKEKIDEIFTTVYPTLAEDKDLIESRDALTFFKNYRLAELGIE